MAFNTPFKLWKRYEFNGGTSDPCIISWPAASTARGELRGQYHHAIDLVPTVLDILGVEPPDHDQGPCPEPLGRDEHALQLGRRHRSNGADDPVLLDARLAGRLAPGLEGGHDPPSGLRLEPLQRRYWELYHTEVDRAELHDLAAEHPDKLRELVNLWFAEAGANQAFPLDDRSALEILVTPRPQLSAPRNRYV